MTLAPIEQDALREVGEIAANAAAVAAHKLVKRRVETNTAQFSEASARQIAPMLGLGAGAPVVGAATRLEGELRGALIVAMPDATARLVSDIMLDRPEGACQKLGALEQSALKELVNILSGGYTKAYVDFLGLKVEWGVPLFVVAGWDPLLKYTYLGTAPGNDTTWVVHSKLHLGTREPAHLILLVDPSSRDAVVRGIQTRLRG